MTAGQQALLQALQLGRTRDKSGRHSAINPARHLGARRSGIMGKLAAKACRS
jgi:hypothetical protein